MSERPATPRSPPGRSLLPAPGDPRQRRDGAPGDAPVRIARLLCAGIERGRARGADRVVRAVREERAAEDRREVARLGNRERSRSRAHRDGSSPSAHERLPSRVCRAVWLASPTTPVVGFVRDRRRVTLPECRPVTRRLSPAGRRSENETGTCRRGGTGTSRQDGRRDDRAGRRPLVTTRPVARCERREGWAP